MGRVDYQEWAANKNFHVGDTLVFNYNSQFHNVNQVTQQGFEACNATSPIATYTNGYDTAGQQIDILVSSPTSSLSPPLSTDQTTEPSAASSLYFSYNLYWTLGVLLASCLSGFAY
ncbi:hypothetical protein NC651_017270 [Populus alba x Populus x berolinensis]|nr:hypothetical protein NC651_017270 [Populus alba x Populus x berolinensis]